MGPDAFGEWRARGETFQFRGQRVFYRQEGLGMPLICLHGFPTASWDWHRIWPELAARYRVIAPDFLGFGYSAKPFPHDYSIREQADLVEALAASLDVRETHLLAHDFGDTVAQELLARHNQGGRLRLRSACLLNGGLFPETHRARLIQKLLLTPLGGLIARLNGRRAFGKSFAAVFGPRTRPSPRELDEFWHLIDHDGGRRVLHLLQRYIPERRANRERWVGALVDASVPLKLVNGPEDPVSGAHMVERYRALVPQPDVSLLPGIGHYPQVEDPAGVLDALLRFLRTVDALNP